MPKNPLSLEHTLFICGFHDRIVLHRPRAAMPIKCETHNDVTNCKTDTLSTQQVKVFSYIPYIFSDATSKLLFHTYLSNNQPINTLFSIIHLFANYISHEDKTDTSLEPRNKNKAIKINESQYASCLNSLMFIQNLLHMDQLDYKAVLKLFLMDNEYKQHYENATRNSSDRYCIKNNILFQPNICNITNNCRL